jgi:hypothetical protein
LQIRVEEVRSRGDGSIEVTFSTAIGTASGIWAVPRFAPTVGRAYGVELTIDVPLIEHETLFSSMDRRASIAQDGAQVVLNGEIERVDDDGVFSFRLAPDCLTLLEPADAAMPDGRWIRIVCPVAWLLVYAHDAY